MTNPNLLSDSSSYPFLYVQPDITSLSPPNAPWTETSTITVLGSGFEPGLTVDFGTESPTPQALTPTQFTVQVGPQAFSTIDVRVTNPNGLFDEEPFAFVRERTVFVTSTLHAGDFGGIAGADAVCAARASSAGLTGTYLAWIGEGVTNPASRFSQTDVFVRPDAVSIAGSWGDLIDGTLSAPINVDETGATVAAASPVWTGVTSSGLSTQPRCLEWTSASSAESGRIGDADATGSAWAISSTQACDIPARIYCFEQ